jgi:hypothetical protein
LEAEGYGGSSSSNSRSEALARNVGGDLKDVPFEMLVLEVLLDATTGEVPAGVQTVIATVMHCGWRGAWEERCLAQWLQVAHRLAATWNLGSNGSDNCANGCSFTFTIAAVSISTIPSYMLTPPCMIAYAMLCHAAVCSAAAE